MALIRWIPRNETLDPFANLADLQDEMNRLFGTSQRRSSGQGYDGGFVPPCDIIEGKDHLLVQMDLPGLSKEDVSVTLQEGVLTIKGERKAATQDKEAQWYLRERVAGSFVRSISLPILVDASKIEARFQDGVLAITLPKAEEAKPKQIEVKIG